MLFLSGTRDRMMTYDLLEPTLHKLGSLAEFEWLETGDHSYATLKRIRDPKDDIFDQMARLITQWFLRIQWEKRDVRNPHTAFWASIRWHVNDYEAIYNV